MKLFIPVICYNRMCHTAFMFSLIKLVLILKEYNIDAELYPIVFDSLINRARNAAVAHFMSSNCSHLLFLDSDIEFNPSDIIKLVLLNKSIVGIGYPKKWLDESKLQNIFSKQELPKNPLNYCTHHSVHIKPGIPKDVNDCMEVDYLTTGIMLINKQVIERLIQKYPERQYINDIDGYMGANKDMFYNFFCVEVNEKTKRFESEDYGFCRLCKEIDEKIYVYTNSDVRHYGWFAYGINIKEELEYRNIEV